MRTVNLSEFLVFFLTTWLLVLSLHLFLYLSLLKWLNITAFKPRLILAIIFFILSLTFVGAILLMNWQDNIITRVFYFGTGLWLALAVNLILASILIWLILALTKIFHLTIDFKILAIVFFISAGFYTVYGLWNAFNPTVKNIEVPIKNLPAAWREKKIIQLSDVHLGLINGQKYSEKLVAQVNAQKPDVILITGDLFDAMPDNLNQFVAPLNQLEAPLGIFFVTGNHENYRGLDQILPILAKTKIQVLADRVINLEGLQIIGVSYPVYSQTRDIKKTITTDPNYQNGRPTVLLFHTPTDIGSNQKSVLEQQYSTYWSPQIRFSLARELGVNLQLSGHTHDGQIFPFNFITKFIYDGYNYGLNYNEDLAIYTSCGVGTWGPPVRTGSRSEIVSIKLK